VSAPAVRADAPAVERRRSWWVPRITIVTVIGALLAAGISGTTLVYTIWPGLRPDPKEKVGADIRALAVDQNVSRAEYTCRTGLTAGRGRPPTAMGNVYYVRAVIEGFKRDSVDLRWFTYDANNDHRLPGLRSNTDEVSVFRPQAPINTQIAEVWVPTPEKTGNYFVRFELYAKAVLLAFVDSRPFETRAFGLPPRHPFTCT
jgi:hypothetical protein